MLLTINANDSDSERCVPPDSGYDLETLAVAEVDADLLVRLAKKRVLHRTPNGSPVVVGHACIVSHFGWPTKPRMASRRLRLSWTTPPMASSASTCGPNST